MRFATLATTSAVITLAALVGCKNADKDAAGTTTTTVASASAASTAASPASEAPAAAKPAEPEAPNAAKVGLKPGEEVATSCDTIAKDSECTVFLVTDPAKKAQAAKVMTMMCKKGTVGEACPTSNILGSCRVGKDMMTHYYSEGGKTRDEATAKADCKKGHGHWVE